MSEGLRLAVLRLTVRTPQALVFDGAVDGLRVPTETGLVGLRPRGEPLVLAIEPGLLVARTSAGPRFLATAGGLLESSRERAVLLSPLAVVGDSEAALDSMLDTVLHHPPADLVLRRKLEELESRILGELSQGAGRAREEARHG